MDTIIISGGLIFGLFLLIKGADEMVQSAIQIAVKFSIPSSIIGAIFIGFGTSTPELFASAGAAIKGDLDLGVGNIIGSNIANSLLVLSVLYIFLPKDLIKNLNLNKLSPVWMGILTVLFAGYYMIFNYFSYSFGVLLLVLTSFIVISLIREESLEQEELLSTERKNLFIRATVALGATIYGSNLVVDNSLQLAEKFGVSSLIVGSTLIAVGTSLPEVASSIAAARMKKPSLVFGNIFGSNLFNLGLVGGAIFMINPNELSSDISISIYYLLISGVILLILAFAKVARNRVLGIILFSIYVSYLLNLF